MLPKPSIRSPSTQGHTKRCSNYCGVCVHACSHVHLWVLLGRQGVLKAFICVMNMEKKFCSLSLEFLNFLDAVPSSFLSKTWDLACVIAYTIQKIIEMGYK
ncbi:unnamed protein product [Rangifer tarandus platyrhynchus]|uniref:Uncharacterized protein n=1 Tax=Rangifer tarandus platyrhynchus TaxID=3082113 RepID=A0AC60A363_RANTA